MNYIGKNIKMIREARGYSQDQVATYLGISRAQLSYYETYTRNEVPSIIILNKLSDLLCVELSTFMEKDIDFANINASFAFRSMEMNDQDINIVTNFHELVKNYVKMQKLSNAH